LLLGHRTVILRLVFMGLPQTTCVHKQKHNTLEALSDALKQEIRAFPRKMLRKRRENFSQRLQECLDKNGRNLTDVILVRNQCFNLFFL
jgi:hypothetical protein